MAATAFFTIATASSLVAPAAANAAPDMTTSKPASKIATYPCDRVLMFTSLQ
jgi:hypothetical protein